MRFILHESASRRWDVTGSEQFGGIARDEIEAVGSPDGRGVWDSGWLGVAAQGQAMPTAEQRASLSVFGGVGGTYTGVGQGRNASMTFGTDYGAWSFAGFRPSVELRGTFPVYEGHLNSQRSILAGVRVEHRLGRFHPYANFLIGGGHINYINDDIVGYIYTTSTVYSPGVGVTRALTRHFSGQVDAQFQHWDTPVTGKLGHGVGETGYFGGHVSL